MQYGLRLLLLLLFSELVSGNLMAQTISSADETSPDTKVEVESSRTIPLKDGSGRNLIIERIKPPAPRQSLPPQPAIKPAPIDPAVRAARQAAWALEAKKEHRYLSLNAVYYPSGQTFLTWFMQGSDGTWQTYEAWTLTDFRSAWLVREFEVGNTVYNLFPCVHPAAKGDLRRLFPGPLYFPEGSPGFRLVKGDPSDAKCIEGITALHEIYRKEGPALTAQWLAQKAVQDAEAARLKANPPPIKDIVVRFYPGGKFKPTPPVRSASPPDRSIRQGTGPSSVSKQPTSN
jgi:hypothetical protein